MSGDDTLDIFKDAPEDYTPPQPLAQPSGPSPSDIINSGATQAPGVEPLKAGTAQQGSAAPDVSTQQPAAQPTPQAQPTQPSPYLQFPTPQINAPAPLQFQQQPAIPQGPQVAQYQPPALTPAAKQAAAKTGEDAYWNQNKGTLDPFEQFLLGAGHGVVTVGAEAKSLGDYLQGKIGKDDWQKDYEAGIPEDVQKSGMYGAGDIAGTAAAYAPVAAGVGAIGTAAGLPAVATGAAALGASALEGSVLGGVGAIHDKAKDKQKANAGDIAGGAAIGGAFGAVGGAIGLGLTKVAKKVAPAVSRFIIDNVKKFAEHVESDILAAEQKQIARVVSLLKQGEGEPTPIGKKQLEIMRAEQAKAADVANGRVAKTGQPGKPRIRMSVDDARKSAHFVSENPSGPVRGVRQGHGGQAAYDGIPLERVLKKLPPELAKQLEAAVKEIGETAILIEHLKKQVDIYARNAIKLATTPAELKKIVQGSTKELKRNVSDKLRKERNELWEQQFKNARRDLGDSATANEKRQYLSAKFNRLKYMTHPLRGLLTLSDTKHVHVVADPTALNTPHDPLAMHFDAAFAQAEDAFRKLVNAEKRLGRRLTKKDRELIKAGAKPDLRHKWQPTFEAVDKHLGVPTRIKAEISHASFGDSKTSMTVGMQYDPSFSKLVGRWADKYNTIMAGIKAGADNYTHKVVHKIAGNFRTTYPGAEKMLSEAGLIHPVAKSVLLAGAIGLQGFRPAQAATLDGETPEPSSVLEAYKLPLALVGGALVAKFGPAGARALIHNSSRFLFHTFYNDTMDLTALADRFIASSRGAAQLHEMDSLTNGLNELRGKLMEMQFRCPDAYPLMARALHGILADNHTMHPDQAARYATQAEIDSLTPHAKQFLSEVQDMKSEITRFAKDYKTEFDAHYKQLSKIDQLGLHEIRAAVHLVNVALGNESRDGVIPAGADLLLKQGFARAAAYNFSLNWKIAATAWLHDTAAFGGLHMGPAAVYTAYGQYTGNPLLRGLVNKMHLGGAATEAAQELNPHATAYGVEEIHTRLAFLGSLAKQFGDLSAEERAHYSVKTADEFAQKVMTTQLPNMPLSHIFQEAALDVSRTTGADVAKLNQTGMERAFIAGNVTKYTRYMMIEQRLIKENVQQIAAFTAQGKYGLALQRAGWIAHALGVKVAYGGTKAAVPVSLYYYLASNPYTSATFAQVANNIDNASIGLSTFGDMGEHGRWDPMLSGFMGQRLPGLNDGLDAIKDLWTLSADANQMMNLISTDPGALVAGSKEDPEVEQGQRALMTMINKAGLLTPKIKGVPLRMVRDALKYFPDFMNKEHRFGVPSTWPIGEAKPAAASKLVEYEPKPGQTQEQADAESQFDALTGMFLGRKPGQRARAFQQGTYAENATHGEADQPEPLEQGALTEK